MKKALMVQFTAVALAVFIGSAPVTAADVQKVTIVMAEFSFTPSKITLQSGVPVELTLVNKGKITHEFMFHAMPPHNMMSMDMDEMHEWYEENSYFKGIEVAATKGDGVKIKRHGQTVVEITVKAGKSVTLKFTPDKTGTFEFACHLPDHYENGQHGIITVK